MEAEREAFEQWFARQPENGGRRPNRADRGDGYYTASTQRMWEAWLARAALGVPEAPAPDLMRRAADAAREAARFHVGEVRDRYEALARELTHGVLASPATVSVGVLRQHWLRAMECDHETKQDKPHCSCSQVDLGWHPSIGAAVEAWLAHVAGLPASPVPNAVLGRDGVVRVEAPAAGVDVPRGDGQE